MYIHARVTISGHFRERVILGYIRFVRYFLPNGSAGYLPRYFIGDENLLIDVANRAFPSAKLCLVFFNNNVSFTISLYEKSMVCQYLMRHFMKNYNKFSTRSNDYFLSLRKKLIVPRSFWIFNSKIAASKILHHIFKKNLAKAMSKMNI